MVNSIVIILISLLASAFFSGMQIALFSSVNLEIELSKPKNIHRAGFIKRFNDHSGQYLATCLVGNISALIVFSFASFALLQSLPVFHHLISVIVVQIIVSAIAFLITGNLLPNAIFKVHQNRMLSIFSIPAVFFFYLFYPVTWSCILAARLLSGSARTNRKNLSAKINPSDFTRKFENSISDPHHELESEIKLFKNALGFTKVRVRDCMIQRPDMEIMEESSGIEELRQKFTETGLSKILIYKDHTDNIIGYVHSFDLFNQPENINSCLREVSFVPETMVAKKLLSKLLKEHKSIAVVVDEFGGTAGMITTEDILEEIFGEIEDEHDKPDFVSKKIDENRYIFSGRIEIKTINEMYDLDLEADASYETIAGYILFHHSNFPKNNAVLQIGRHEFRILRSSRTSIDIVEMRILEK